MKKRFVCYLLLLTMILASCSSNVDTKTPTAQSATPFATLVATPVPIELKWDQEILIDPATKYLFSNATSDMTWENIIGSAVTVNRDTRWTMDIKIEKLTADIGDASTGIYLGASISETDNCHLFFGFQSGVWHLGYVPNNAEGLTLWEDIALSPEMEGQFNIIISSDGKLLEIKNGNTLIYYHLFTDRIFANDAEVEMVSQIGSQTALTISSLTIEQAPQTLTSITPLSETSSTTTATIPVGLNTLVPESVEAITSVNVNMLTQLACWGKAPFRKMIYSQSMNQLISVDICGNIKTYDADTLKEIFSMPIGGQVTGIEMSLDGKIIITANKVGQFNYFDLTNGLITRTINGPVNDSFSLGNYRGVNIISLFDERNLGVYGLTSNSLKKHKDIQTWDQKNITAYGYLYPRELTHELFNSGQMTSSFSPDGHFLLVNRFGGFVIYQAPDFLYVNSADTNWGSDAIFSPDGKFVYFMNYPIKDQRQRYIQRWDIENNEQSPVLNLSDLGNGTFRGDERFIISRDGKSIFLVQKNWVANNGGVTPDGFTLYQLNLAANSISTKIPVDTLIPDANNIVIDNILENPNSGTVYLSSDAGNIYEVNIQTKELLNTNSIEDTNFESHHTLDTNPAMVKSETKNNEITLRSLPDGSLIKQLKLDENNHLGCFSKKIYVINTREGDSENSTITGYDLNNESSLFSINSPDQVLYASEISQDGSLVILKGEKQAGVWSTKDSLKLADLDPLQYHYFFSPDGKTLASTSGDEYINIWDTQTGKLRVKLPYASGNISRGYNFYWSQDSQTLVSINNIGFTVWNTQTGATIKRINYGGSNSNMSKYGIGGTIGPTSAAINPDGNIVAIYDGWGVIFLFDYKNEKLTTQINIPGPATGGELLFSQDGKYLYAISHDGSVIHEWGILEK